MGCMLAPLRGWEALTSAFFGQRQLNTAWRDRSRSLVRGRDYCVFGIAGHAELWHVQAFLFCLGGYAHAFCFVHAPEDYVGCAEGPDGVERCSHELAEELAGIAVEQAGDALAGVAKICGGADAVPARAVGAIGEDADADRAQPAAVAVDGDGAAGIVDFQHAVVEENAAAHQKPASTPMIVAEVGDTKAQGR
jgi:hypothetical protein